MQISGKGFSAIFDLEINNFKSIYNKISNDEYVKSTPRFPLISLIVWEEGTKKELYPENGSVTQQNDKYLISYSAFGGKAICAQLSIYANENKIIISADIQNNSSISIIETVLPRISGIYLGKTYSDDIILYPHHAGERSENPILRYKKMAEGEWGRHWRAASAPVDNYFRREINYCGLASMSWMYYHDKENGLYIGSHDPRFPLTGIIAETSGDEENPWMGFAFRKHNKINHGETYNTGEYCIAISCDDWHYGAKIYREYINPLLNIQPNPDFLADESALHQCYNFKHSGHITRRFKDIPDIYEKGAQWGVRHLFMASWNRTGFDSCYPEYYPDMELGSAMEFRRGIEYVKEKGGFSTLYLNARIFDVKSDFHAAVGEKMAIRTVAGKPIEEVYGPAHFTVSCPSDSLWQNYFIDSCDFAALAYGAQGIYLDQLASAEPHPCFCEEHSHKNIGEFNQGYIYIMSELLKKLRKRNPQAYLMVENCGDIYGAYAWGSLTWNGDQFDEYYNLFKFTFPEYVQINMTDPRAWVNEEDQVRSWFYKDMQRAILLGSILWLGITDHLERYAPEYEAFAKIALKFRQSLQPLIKRARYLDNAFVQSVSENCDASCWQLNDGKTLLIIGNHTLAKNASAEFAFTRDVKCAEGKTISGESVACSISGNKLNINIEKQRLYSVIVTV